MSVYHVKRPFRLAILASHPVQYHVPLFRTLAAHPTFATTVFYCGRWGVEQYFDRDFGQKLAWDVDLLKGYAHRFLRNLSLQPEPATFFGTFSPEICQIIRQDPPDALLVHGWARATNWLAMFAAWQQGIPVWMRGESTLLQDTGHVKRVVKRAVLSHLFPRLELFLTIGRRNQAFYEAWGVSRDRMVLVPYTADNDFFTTRALLEPEARRRVRTSLGIPADTFLVLVSGKLIPRKRPMDALEACAMVSRHSPVCLAYVGDGIERARLEHRARQLGFSEVVFLGVQNQSAMPAIYSASDLLMLPSGFEPWGMVVNEAMCCGLPVIVSDRVGAGADLVTEGINGFVYPAGDVPTLADRLMRIVRSPGLSRAMAIHSSQTVKEWSLAAGIDALARRVGARSDDLAATW